MKLSAFWYLYALPLATVILAQITSPSDGATFAAGSTINIQWAGGDSPATIVLETGVPQIPPPSGATTIASNIPNTGSYSWTIPSNISPADDYAIVIYGSDFDITGGNFKIGSLGTGASSSASSSLPSTTSPPATSPPATSHTSSTPLTTSPGVSNSTTPIAHSGLSKGATTGIGVGVALGVLLLIGLLIFLYYRRRSVRAGTKTEQVEDAKSQPNTYEMGAGSSQNGALAKGDVHEMEQEKQGVMKPQLQMGEAYQLDGKPVQPYELDPNSHMLGAELDANERPFRHELGTTPRPAVAANLPSDAGSGAGFSVSRKPVQR